ncbi:conserved domain protein, putative [Aciduliprofundum boonei T469]|nr:conserved domain protein, putative [Aciduliprofundum boonei T469]
MVGQIIGGNYGEILIRQKNGERIELGELLVADDILLQVVDLEYGSLMENRDLARMSGMQLEGYGATEIHEKEVRNFILVRAKPVFDLNKKGIPKHLPEFFKILRRANAQDFDFLEKPKNPMYLGKIRSGSKVLNVPVYLDGKKVLTHHILIPATTGRGKSNLVKVILWSLVHKDYAGILVLDAHNEYYSYKLNGKNYGLKEHPEAKGNVIYYSINPPLGERALKINIKLVRPWHLREIIEFTPAQEDALYLFYKEWGDEWIKMLFSNEQIKGVGETTRAVIQRKVKVALEIDMNDYGELYERGKIFSINEGESTIKDICNYLEEGKIVIVDTSSLSQNLEILISSMIMNEVFARYKRYKENGELDNKPVISVVIEEAPRVLGEGKSTIFGTIAREGRKFKIGIIAITQLSSVIPREILANLNTKIILGNEMSSERKAVISSAAQDLSKDDKMIASLDKGEAIVSSIFTKFAIPIQIERFEELVDRARKEKNPKTLKFFG